MSKISEAFNNGKAFIPFITCGDPYLETTKDIVCEMAGRGADLIELGIPFSDPTAEGPVIQAANLRALQGGVTTDQIFQMARELREDRGLTLPLVFMTYANVVYSYGTDRFCAQAQAAGIDGLILPDVPYEERPDFTPACGAHGLDLIAMVAPTSEDRIGMIAREAEGFIYVVSSLGVTGTRTAITTDIGAIVRIIRSVTDVPCAVGFGISTPDQARRMAQASDGAIVGSAIVKQVAALGREAVPAIGDYVQSMKDAIRDL